MDNRPIGVFDSGIGGLTVVDALANRLPNETIYYVGDTAMVPYAIIAEAHHPEHIPPLTGMTPVSELTTDALDEDATLAMATLLSALKFATA